MDMVERVARANSIAMFGYDCIPNDFDLAWAPGSRTEMVVRSAKAAIRAMLEGQEPVAWRYDHPVFGCPIYKEPQELKRLGGDTQETPLYDLSALKEAVG